MAAVVALKKKAGQIRDKLTRLPQTKDIINQPPGYITILAVVNIITFHGE